MLHLSPLLVQYLSLWFKLLYRYPSKIVLSSTSDFEFNLQSPQSLELLDVNYAFLFVCIFALKSGDRTACNRDLWSWSKDNLEVHKVESCLYSVKSWKYKN